MNPMRSLAVLTTLLVAVSACEPSPDVGPSDPDEASTPSAGEPSASASATASASPPAAVGWELVLTFGDEGTSEVAREVVHGNAGFLAITEQFVSGEGGPRLMRRSMWLSADGRTWEEVDLPSGLADAWLQAVTTTSAGDYVLHFNVLSGADITPVEAIRSADGRTWEQIETGLPEELQIMTIEHGALGSLLVGQMPSPDTTIPEAWYSSDGVTWELVHEVTDGDRWVTVADAGAGDEGFVIVGASAAPDNSSHEYFALASADGREWIESRSPFGPEDPDFRPNPHVAALGPDWVAVLPTRDESIQFWSSEDGLAWASAGQITDTGPLEAFEPVFHAVDSLLHFSITGGGFPWTVTGAWSSTGGATWEPLELGADVYLGGVAAGPETVVLTGSEPNPTGSQAGIWVRQTD